MIKEPVMIETIPCENARNWLAYNGHGHVVERSDGQRARCGGPSICEVCRVELRLKRLIDEDRAEFESRA